LTQLADRAAEIARLYEDSDRAAFGRPWTRREMLLGFTVAVADLAKLVQAVEGVRCIPRADERLEHELADCLWSLLVIAGLYGVDIEQAFLLNMDQLEAQLKSQTG